MDYQTTGYKWYYFYLGPLPLPLLHPHRAQDNPQNRIERLRSLAIAPAVVDRDPNILTHKH